MITEQALSEVGIQSQKKNVDPDWYFISLAYFLMLLFIFGCIGVIILGYNLRHNNISLFGGKSKKVNTIYYDNIDRIKEEERNKRCWNRCCSCLKNKVTAEEDAPDAPVKKQDLDFGYNDMTKLKEDLDAAHIKLRKLMKDLDKKKARAKVDEDGLPGKHVEPEDELIEELVAFSAFIKANQDCLKDVEFGKPNEGDWFMADEDKNALKAETVEVIETREQKTTLI